MAVCRSACHRVMAIDWCPLLDRGDAGAARGRYEGQDPGRRDLPPVFRTIDPVRERF
jgi:hypothetical protein